MIQRIMHGMTLDDIQLLAKIRKNGEENWLQDLRELEQAHYPQ